jgi:hypothetical protein
LKAGNAIGILGKLFGQDFDRHVAANLSQERHEFDPGDNTKCNPGSDDLMGLIENDPMVEKLPATTSKPALRNSILPRAGWACACTMKPRTFFSAEFAADVYRARQPGASSKSGNFSRFSDELPAKGHLFNDRYLCAWENSPCNTLDGLLWA